MTSRKNLIKILKGRYTTQLKVLQTQKVSVDNAIILITGKLAGIQELALLEKSKAKPGK